MDSLFEPIGSERFFFTGFPVYIGSLKDFGVLEELGSLYSSGFLFSSGYGVYYSYFFFFGGFSTVIPSSTKGS